MRKIAVNIYYHRFKRNQIFLPLTKLNCNHTFDSLSSKTEYTENMNVGAQIKSLKNSIEKTK